MEPGGGLFVLRPALADLQVTLGRVRRRAASSDTRPARVRFRVANAGPASAGNARCSLSGRATPLALAAIVDVVFPHRMRPARFHASVQADEVDTRPQDNVVRNAHR